MNIENLVRGDTIIFEVKADTDITNWKIRAELYDTGTINIKKATANTGGADSQILITDAVNGVFTIKINKGETTTISDQATLEIEMENTLGEVWTVFQSIIQFINEKITWTNP